MRFPIFDLRLPISNAECEKDRALFYRDDSRSDAASTDSFRPACSRRSGGSGIM